MDFIKKILSFESSNLVFAPSNIFHAFGLLLDGAQDQTEREIVSILGQDNVEQCKAWVKHGFDTGERFETIRQAANIFVNEKHQLKPEYISTVLKKYEANVENINFGDSSKAADLINSWVMGKTDNLINDLVTPDMFNNLTLLALVTAVVFKGSWESKFETIEDDIFNTENGKTKNVKFMSLKKKRHFGTYFDNGITCVRIPYKDGLAMTIIMPDGDINHFESTVTAEKLNYLIDQPFASAGEVTLKMPKFKFASQLDLKETLTKAGHDKIFDQNQSQNYKKMTSADIFISEAVHKAVIDVDENGTVAAAATGMVAMLRCLPPQPIEIKISRPFLFFIHSDQTQPGFYSDHGQTILFAGRLIDPIQ